MRNVSYGTYFPDGRPYNKSPPFNPSFLLVQKKLTFFFPTPNLLPHKNSDSSVLLQEEEEEGGGLKKSSVPPPGILKGGQGTLQFSFHLIPLFFCQDGRVDLREMVQRCR